MRSAHSPQPGILQLGASSSGSSPFVEALERHARERPDSAAVAHRTLDGSFEVLSYAELSRLVEAYAALFEANVPERGIVPLCMGRTPHAVAAILGALRAQRAFCSVNPKLRLPQVQRILADTAAPFAAVDAAGLASLKEGAKSPGSLGSVRWAIVDDGSLSGASAKLAEGFRVWASAGVWEPRADRASEWRVRAEDRAAPGAGHGVACCLFTSGSTGVPKGVLISASDLTERARAEAVWYGLGSADVLLNLLPFSFDVGLNQLLSAVLSGAELVLLDSWLPADLLRAAAARSVTGISAVPSIWGEFLRGGQRFDRRGSHRSLRYITVSGGDLSAAQHERLPALADGAAIFKTYGQTEAFRAASLLPEEYAARPYSVGRAFSGVNLYVVREDGTRAQPGERGEIVHSGLGVMLGYLGGGAEPDGKLRKNPFRGPSDPNELAIFTGDIGYLDADGYLFLTGRRDDLVKCNGNRVYPAEVRNELSFVEGVAVAEVVVVRSESNARLAAFVVPQGSVELDSTRVQLALRSRVPSYMVPELIVVSSALPRTASGKPDRQALVAEAAARFERGREQAARPSGRP